MNTNELKILLERDGRISKYYNYNVFALDQFLTNRIIEHQLNGLYIVNDEISSAAGSHWIIVFFDEKQAVFFDSFAKTPNTYGLDGKLKNIGKKFSQLQFPLQSSLSTLCGEYCIFFSYHLSRGHSLQQVMKYFKKDNEEVNDLLVKRFVYKLYGFERKVTWII